METSNIFENISEHIIRHIKGAENAIYICVPWLTDETILHELVEKSRQKVHIEIITLNDEFSRAKASYFNKLIANGSKVYLIEKSIGGGIPHLKFCVIDDETLITGSYNWSNNAKNNDENIIIKVINDFEDYGIINDYNIQFSKMLYKYGIKDETDEENSYVKAMDYIKSCDAKHKVAGEYFDLASSLYNERKYEEALSILNEGISKLPHPNQSFYLLKFKILLGLRKYLEATDNLYSYLWEIAINDYEQIEVFKTIYDKFIKIIKDDGMSTYKLIADINQKTKVKLGKFALLEIEPHFFSDEELDTIPF
jgi:tetratricopeptide (TPR) repeat protein